MRLAAVNGIYYFRGISDAAIVKGDGARIDAQVDKVAISEKDN